MQLTEVVKRWQELAMRQDLIGQEVQFDNRVGDCLDKGSIGRIMVENGYVRIESPEMEKAYRENRAWSPGISFKLDEDRYPEYIGGMIFCDLDEYRQVRIAPPAAA